MYLYISPTIDATPANSSGKQAIMAEGTAATCVTQQLATP